MAKRKKNEPVPEGWQDAVDASDALDDQDDGPDGVEHDGAGPVYLRKLSEEEHRAVGDQLAATLVRIEELKAEKKKVTKEFKDDITDLEEKRDVLRDEWRSGVRKEGAQPDLPGMDS